MADFSFLSDSSDEIAVEELLSQATDLSVLEQVAAINCSGFTRDSVLPTHLETRFSRLKSFPAAKPKPPTLSTDKKSVSSRFDSEFPSVKSPNSQFENSVEGVPESHSLSDDEKVIPKEDPTEKKVPETKLGSGSGSPPPKSPSSPAQNSIFSPFKQTSSRKMSLKSKSRSGSLLSPSNSSNLSVDSPSPPKKTGCFWCSPKKVSRKKIKENRVIGGNGVGWGEDSEEFLSDLRIFSAKEQQKILKKAMKEEEKINREAEKIVKWAKQASARINISDIEDELSDCENSK